jgi:putative photosynthetic complex assembly protein
MSDVAAAPARTTWSIPREAVAPSLLIAAILMAALWVTLDAWASKSRGTSLEPIVDRQTLTFKKQPDGRFVARRTADGMILAAWSNTDDGFVPMVMRGVAHERRRHQIAVDEPIELLRRPDGRVTLRDPELGTTIELKAFGPGNHAAFAGLMTAARSAP